MSKNVLIIGGNGREHALAWKISQSPLLGSLYVAPGNAGTGLLAQNVAINVMDTKGLLRFAESHAIDLTIVGPDDPLAAGIVDAFQEKGLKIFGPTKTAAQIEWSKAFAKQLMKLAKIPTANFKTFDSYFLALQYANQHGAPIVIKASGLALGKGVYICKTLMEAIEALRNIMVRKIHKQAGQEVVIEDFLTGQEVSIHAFCDGHSFKLFPVAQDHKPIFDHDQGPNTGGMGTISPLPWFTPETLKQVGEEIVQPTLRYMAAEGRPFTGLLYPGLMMTPDGIKVLEYNARFGDPEAMNILPLLQTDFVDICEAIINGALDRLPVTFDKKATVCKYIVPKGYGLPKDHPDAQSTAARIEVGDTGQARLYYSSVDQKDDGLYMTTSRAIGVVGVADNLHDAEVMAENAVAAVRGPVAHRPDIGTAALIQKRIDHMRKIRKE